jgi:hypothetical protein
VEEHNAHYREEYGDKEWAKHLAPCDCGFHLPDMLCTCWPESRTPEDGRKRLEFHYRREHDKGLKAKREFPRLERCPLGVCYWCRQPIVHGRAKQRSMHDGREDEPDCAWQYALRTRAETQASYLLSRDGIGCKGCGVAVGRWQRVCTYDEHALNRMWAQDGWLKRKLGEKPGGPFTWVSWSTSLEVDHVIPLAAAWEAFPEPERRRWFFGPANLQALCPNVLGSNACHAAKTREDVAFIRACQANGREWAKAEVLRRLADTGQLRASPAKGTR